MKIRKLAMAAVVSSAVGVPSSYAQDRVIIEGTSTQSSGGMSFDTFMSNYFGGSGYTSDSFSAPESEAYSTTFSSWIKKPVTPKAAMTVDACVMKYGATARNITANSEPMERVNAARELYFQNLPNFANTKKDGLIIAVIFGDGSQELYRHTTFYGVLPLGGTFVPGTGSSRCPAAG